MKKQTRMQVVAMQFVLVLLFAASGFAQFGVKTQTPFPQGGPVPSQPLKGATLDGTKVFAYNFVSNGYVSLDLPSYNNMTSLISSSTFIGGADFDNAGDLYAIQATSPALYKVDFGTATVASLGTVSGLPSQYLVGLAYDNRTQTMYCLQSNWGTNGNLYTINLSTLTATLVGTITGMTRGESLAFNAKDGMLYSFDFKSEQSDLLKIDPATAAATVVGSTTAFLNYASGWFGDCDFNDTTGELIFSTYDSGTSSIWSINATNGTATLVGTASNAQLVLAVNTAGRAASVPIKGSAILLLFMIPAMILVWRMFSKNQTLPGTPKF